MQMEGLLDSSGMFLMPASGNVLCCCVAPILQAVPCGCVVRHDGAVRGNSLEDHGQVSGEVMLAEADLSLCQARGTFTHIYMCTYLTSIEWRGVLCYGFVGEQRAVDMLTYTL